MTRDECQYHERCQRCDTEPPDATSSLRHECDRCGNLLPEDSEGLLCTACEIVRRRELAIGDSGEPIEPYQYGQLTTAWMGRRDDHR